MSGLKKSNLLLFFAAIFSVSVISVALALQLFGGFQPCHLCLQERIPYYVGVPLTVIALLASLVGSNLSIACGGLLTCVAAVVFAYGVDTSIYHVGVEWGHWAAPTTCNQTGADLKNLNDFISQLNSTAYVDCSKPALVVFGLSLAGWNVLASLFLIALLLASGKFRADYIFSQLKG